MTDGKRLIDEAREARVLSPEARAEKEAREDRRAAAERASGGKPQCDSPERRSPRSTSRSGAERGWPSLRREARLGEALLVEGETDGMIGGGE